MTETHLEGGDMNPVVRVGDTVRRPPGPESVRQLLFCAMPAEHADRLGAFLV
jgi:hypothetical protein